MVGAGRNLIFRLDTLTCNLIRKLNQWNPRQVQEIQWKLGSLLDMLFIFLSILQFIIVHNKHLKTSLD